MYKITHPQKQGALNGFFSNGGWSIGDVFAFSQRGNFIYKTEKEAQDRILAIIKTCKNQQGRWGDWTDKAISFANRLTYQTS